MQTATQKTRQNLLRYREKISLPEFRDSAVEQAFWRHQDAQIHRTRVLFLIVGLLIYLLFSVLDANVGQEATTAMLAARGVSALTLIVGIVLLTMPGRTPDQRERAIEMCAFSTCIGETVLIVLAPADAIGHYQFGLGVIMSVGALMIVPRFGTMARVVSITILAYVATIPWHAGSMTSNLVNTFYILLIGFAVLVGSFERERLARLQAVMAEALAASNAGLKASRHEALLARDEAIAANKAKNRFLASVSHELRTPMNAILGFSGMIRSEIFGPLNSRKYAEYIEHIHSSGLLLQTNIDDLLDLARLEAGKIGWVDETFRLDTALENVLATCKAATEEAEVPVRICNDVGRLLVSADPTRIAQAVINLVTNAVKFSKRGQEICVRVEQNDAGDCLIHVIDTGCGMSPENVAKVRMPFAQAHEDSYSKGKGGLGLGLAIVSGIVATMDGRLDLESEEGTGTKATLVIPAFRIATAMSDAA